jgi:outer membrane protein assembly factor BamB
LSLGETKALVPVDLVPETASDFPEFRGRQRDGVAYGPALARDWKSSPPRLLWGYPVGGGYAAFAVSGNTAVTIEQRHKREVVVCYDTNTGQELWIYSYPALFSEWRGGDGPRATPTISGSDVFSLGATGRLVCLDRGTGGEKWVTDTLKDNANLTWGMSGSPLVYGQVVVVNPGTQKDSAAGRALVAYDRNTGQEVWQAGNNPAAYCSPMLVTLAGQRQILIFDGKGLAGHEAATGKELWRYPWETMEGINVAQPLLLEGDRLFISSGYNKGCSLLQVSQKNGSWSAAPVWAKETSLALRCRFTSPVAYQGFIYGLDEGILVCLDPSTGKARWKGERYGNGQVLRYEDLLLVLSETGKLALVEANPEKPHELGRFPALEGDKTWNTPALANGKVYVRNHKERACFDLRMQK